MSDSIFDDLDNQKDNVLDVKLADSLELLVKSYISEKNTILSKRELKAISILKQNKYIWKIIQDYVPNKRYVSGLFGKRLEKIIENISNAIGQKGNQVESESRFSKFFNRFR